MNAATLIAGRVSALKHRYDNKWQQQSELLSGQWLHILLLAKHVRSVNSGFGGLVFTLNFTSGSVLHERPFATVLWFFFFCFEEKLFRLVNSS
ncbi:unnamed protein product, partial [Ceratitis capitata]